MLKKNNKENEKNNRDIKSEEKKRIIEFTTKMKEIDSFTEKEEKELNIRLFVNMLLAIGVIVYFYLINLGYKNIAKDIFITDLHVFSMTILAASIVLFEKSYKNENEILCVYGIEMLVLAILTLFMPYIYFYSNPNIRIIYSCLSIYITI